MIEPSQDIRPEDIGTRLRAVRELMGARLGDVAKSAGLSRRELQAAERGAKRLSADQLHALAGALSVDPDVLVGVGFEGELVRAGTASDRTGQVIRPDSLAPSVPGSLADPDRRGDDATRQRIEQSWREVRNEMRETFTTCTKLVSAGAGDDVRRLIERLEYDLQVLKSSRTFQRNLADHERALTKVRGAGPGASSGAFTSTVLESR